MPESPSSPRDLRTDAAKGVLICLVVLGHLLEVTNFWDAQTFRLPLTAIYLFHMPAFVFLAGATSRTGRLLERVGGILVLLVTFQVLYWLFDTLAGTPKQFSYFPFWTLWFLLALAYWQAALPAIRRFPRSALAVCAAAGAGAGVLDAVGNDFALSRALVFLPFYAAGALYGRHVLALAARCPPAARAGLVLACAALAWLVFRAQLSPWWFFANRSYERLHSGVLEGVWTRTGLLAMSALMVFTLLCLVPGRQGPAAAAGRRSLAVYLFHGFVVMALAAVMPSVLSGYGRWTALGACLLITAAIVAVCSHPVLDRALRVYRDRATGLLFRLRRPLRAGT
ncbi:acyltransferase family protein [Arthrobacter deserti]|uniref:Acyltransferase family protein n=1 Tax=Arthrobacter deserti TaxID=1742687 RepID=A0ABX1JKW2_9MICC|nr:acyltransferase family protein [Arthrobacter deserti]